MTKTEMPGTASLAEAITNWHFDGLIWGDDMPAGFEHLDQGSERTVYLHRASATVYKVGRDSANRQEVRTLTELRDRGIQHAPAATLWSADVEFRWGPETRTCVAMPYLPEDGSVPHAGLVLEGAGDLNPANVHAHGGQLWLIDAGGM